MIILRRKMRYRLWLILLSGSMLIVAGCWPGSYGGEKLNRGRSFVREARSHQQGGHSDKALGAYLKAIKADPDYARAHFDCAVLLQDDFSDYVGAIYHYRRYLDLKPATEKREMVKERIRVASQSLVGKLSGRGNGNEESRHEFMRKYAQLRKENERLKDEIASLQARLERFNGGELSVDRSVDGFSSLPGDGAVPDDRLYRVKAGETLSRIAIKMYGNAEGSERIFEANRDRLDSPDDLKAGQVLVIPHE